MKKKSIENSEDTCLFVWNLMPISTSYLPYIGGQKTLEATEP